MSQIEIAHELQVSKQLISSDVQYLRNQAKEYRLAYNILYGIYGSISFKISSS